MRLPAALLLALASSSRADLSVIASAAPSALPAGSVITLEVRVQAAAPGGATSVSPSVSVLGSGSALKLSGPVPASADLVQGAYQDFTFTYSATGCGSLQFSALALGQEAGGPASKAALSGPVTACVGSPTPTPALSPTPTATPTLWVVYVTPNEGPEPGYAKALGNVFNPLKNGVELQYSAPFAGRLTISIYTRLGQRVRRFEKDVWAGQGSETWDGRGEEGSVVGSGIYLAHFQAKGLNRTIKLVVVK